MNKLNPAQLQAATHIDGPLLILAGAGTGKTQTMISRLVYLITQVGIPAEQILVLTFTNKAAAAMNARAVKMLREAGFARPESHGAVLSTFHSWGMQFLAEHIALCDSRRENFRIIDDAERADILKECARTVLAAENFDANFALKAPNKSAAQVKDEKELAKDAYKAAREAINRAKATCEAIADATSAAIAKAYEAALQAANLCDFDDLILLPIAMLEAHEQLRARTQERWQYLMVDEYQDTNVAQLRLLKLLASERQNVVVVGDDDQSIYSFRHATVENILGFEHDFAGAKIIRLEQNYRSSKTILAAANQLIAKNFHRHGKTLFSELETGERIEILRTSDDICEQIESLLAAGVRASEIAVIYRLNMLGNFLEPKLIMRQIPYRVLGQIAFFMRAEIKILLAYIRLWLNPADNQAFLRAINQPRRGFGDAAEQKLRELAYAQGSGSLFTTLENNLAAFKNSTKLREFCELFQSLGSFEIFCAKLRSVPVAAIFDDPAARDEHIAEFFAILSSALGGGASNEAICEFLNQITLASEALAERRESVNLLSIHAAKGLEFEYVFIAGAERKYMPSPQAFGEAEMEEERRLMYVAITRAKKRLWVQFEGAPCEYLEQMGLLDFEGDEDGWGGFAREGYGRERVGGFARGGQKSSYAAISPSGAELTGRECVHKVFGTGLIEQVIGKDILLIHFYADSPGKLRTLNAAFVQIL